MAKRVSVDRWLFAVTLLLVMFGLLMIFSASAVMAKEKFGSAYVFVLKQLGWACAGIAAMVGLMRVDYRRYKHPAVVFSLLAFTTTLLVLVFFLDRSHNTHRWIHLAGFSFQPSELAKPVIVLFMAYFLETRLNAMEDWRRTILPAAVPTLIFTGLILKQPDLGTAMVCVAVSGVILVVAGMQLRYFGWGALAATPILYYMLWMVPWRRARLEIWLNPQSDPQGKGFHMVQSLIAVGTGGFSGLGLMEGKQKLFYLPEPHTDFIFAVVAEELGLLGAIMVVTLFAIFCYRGLRTAFRTQDPYARMLALGITSTVAIQAFFNISVVLGILPAKGIPLPFISYGGSALFMMLASVGILLNITRQTD